MGEGPIVWLAVFGGAVAAACAVACACACAWLARATGASAAASRRAPPRATTVYVPQPPPTQFPPIPAQHAFPPQFPAPHHHGAQLSLDRIPGHVVLDGASTATAAPRAPIVLEGRYPQLGSALGAWMQVEPDGVERIRIARDLGTVGGAGSARALLDGVRTGVLSPTVAADQLERGGFEAGITVAAALQDPEPRVRALASSLVGRTTPLEPARLAQPLRPMPNPPSGPPS